MAIGQGSTQTALRDQANGQLAGVTASGRLKVDSLSSSSPTGNDDVENNRMYALSVDISALSASTDNPLILFKNPAGSGKVIKLHRIMCACTIENVQATFALYHSPTITANTVSITSSSTNIGNSAPSAVALAYSGFTLSSTGTRFISGAVGQNNSPVELIKERDVYLQENTAIVLTSNPKSNSRNMNITIIWAEV